MLYLKVCEGVDSFPLKINKGNKVEKTHVPSQNDSIIDVAMDKIAPKPKKYGQLFSTNVSLLCNSHPILNHLYSNEYNEYKKHI